MSSGDSRSAGAAASMAGAAASMSGAVLGRRCFRYFVGRLRYFVGRLGRLCRIRRLGRFRYVVGRFHHVGRLGGRSVWLHEGLLASAAVPRAGDGRLLCVNASMRQCVSAYIT